MTKFLNISTDNTLGGSSSSNETVSSQKAIKEYVDGSLSGYLQNTATGTNSVTILGTAATTNSGVNIGIGSSVADSGDIAIGYNAQANGDSEHSIAIGYNSRATGAKSVAIKGSALANGSIAIGGTVSTSKNYSIAIGCGVECSGYGAIQLGGYNVTNSENGSFYVALTNSGASFSNYKLLDSGGKIPDARLNTPIPSQTGNAGKFLTTDGTDISWGVAVKSVNDVSPVNGNVTLSIPVVEEYTSAEVDTLWNSITANS